ncbi:hypothetical protein ACFOWU_09525 [Epilithonimonas zeae]|uniref:Uncharacterized protein n=1 Tax=Epilithonimonas zeae TaxID=1416779 RepID=A0A1N6GQE2_9FLAO|nr:ATP-binding protein [Epilithonimonas zeae]SIO09771.1 hypothetical protein SAMN05444409_1987 [Epilithonimonas zeae]
MDNKLISAKGERAAIGGYLPQFDEFAWFVYLNLINKSLSWIKVADPEAEKLDDIQYSTSSEVHAYQVKWTIAEADISYTNFISLLPVIVSSWKNLKRINVSKKVIPHLITNKKLSTSDTIKIGNDKIGSFNDFINEVWKKLRNKYVINDKWNPVIEDLKKTLNVEEEEFNEFVEVFDFHHAYKQREFSVTNSKYLREDNDLQDLSRFIIEKVASPIRLVEFSRLQIIQELGWESRFKTTFNHDIVIDRKKYQPITSSLDLLSSKVNHLESGYVFLSGGPGSGKSTLLNQWSKASTERIIKYYAFDFANPSSHLNYYERGNAIHLFFDLVFQIKEEGIYKRDILPYKDLVFLKDVFYEQIKYIGEEYNESQQKTIIIIDGLDHVPREYKSASTNFLRELPLPATLPSGVIIILGSQSYDLSDIPQEVKSEQQNSERTIKIDSLRKEDVYNYIDNVDFIAKVTIGIKSKIYEKSQGHPLYLSYLVEKLSGIESLEEVIDSLPTIEGDIDNYYKKIWEPINQEENLVSFLGLIARIKGLINIGFLQEWSFERATHKSFNEKAKILFNEENKALSFFHNSFKQFLLTQTAINYLNNDFDFILHRNYHKQLAEYYEKSTIEQRWNQNYHLFESEDYDKFLSVATPEDFTAQLLNFRPTDEIKKDINLGIEISRKQNNLIVLLKYLFCSAEIESRLFNINPASLTEELLEINKFSEAVGYLRSGNVLHCSESYALKASRIFLNFGYKSEAELLYNLAYPEIIINQKILIENSHNYRDTKDSLQEWVTTAAYFESIDNILLVVNSIEFSNDTENNRFEEKESDLRVQILESLGYSIIQQNKWDDFSKILSKVNTNTKKGKNVIFHLFQNAIEECIDRNDNNRAIEFISSIKRHFTIENTSPIGRIFIADLIFKVTQDIIEVCEWIENIKHPSKTTTKEVDLGYSDSLDPFIPLIKFNKLLNLCNKGVPITVAIPSVASGSDEEVLVEFERMLCLISQVVSEGIMGSFSGEITQRMIPVVKFYYKEISPRNSYWYKIQQCKEEYFNLLIYAVSLTGKENINKIAHQLFLEFDNNKKYWSSKVQRKIVSSLIEEKYSKDICVERLQAIESFMLDNHDIDGRVRECIDQANIYFQINENSASEKWLKQAIQESIGIGYRKDYQFTTWIRWLREINKVNPVGASDRIVWFLSHLNHIKETTEGRAYWDASEDLLEVAYENNLSDGVLQSNWQIKNGLIDFNEALALFIKYFTKQINAEQNYNNAVNLYCDLYLLLSESTSIKLLKEILKKGFEICGENIFKNQLSYILNSININAFEADRMYLLKEIDNFFVTQNLNTIDHFPDFILPNDKENTDSSSNELVLKPDYKRLSENQVLEQIKSYDDFKEMLQNEDKGNSYFNWSKVIDKLEPIISLDNIKDINGFAKITKRESIFYSKMSEIALNKGDSDLARDLAEKSIELSSESGWVKHYDGGSRIEAFTALKKIDSSAATKKAFEVFSYNVIETGYPSSYFYDLRNIIGLLTESYPEVEIWNEVFKYLQRLMSNSKPLADLPLLNSLDIPLEKVYVDYLVELLKSPVNIIREKAIILFAKSIEANNKYASDYLTKRKLNDYSIIEIIASLFHLNPEQTINFVPLIEEYAVSKDFEIRRDSIEILNFLGRDIPQIQFTILPAIYSLKIPDIKSLKSGRDYDPYFPTLDVENPNDLIRPFGYIINYISKISGVDRSNLLIRTQSLMKELGNENEWSVDFEKEIRSHLEDINLKYSFHRPRVIAALRAINQLASDLIDANFCFSEELSEILKDKDRNVSFFSVIKKPAFIPKIEKDEFVRKDWVDKIDDNVRLQENNFINYDNGFKIIGEYNIIKNLDWGSPTEEFSSQIAIINKIDNSEPYIFGSVFHESSDNYHKLNGGGHFIIVHRDHRFGQFDVKSKWIAINPVLARHLSWIPEPKKLFAWKNKAGELMVESIFWASGNMNMTPRKDGEVGEGWFVIASDKAIEEIKNIEKKLFFQKKLVRSIFEDGELIENEKLLHMNLRD